MLFCTQFGKQFVHFVFLEAHVSAVSRPLRPTGTFSCSVMFELLLVLHYVLFSLFVLANKFYLI